LTDISEPQDFPLDQKVLHEFKFQLVQLVSNRKFHFSIESRMIKW